MQNCGTSKKMKIFAGIPVPVERFAGAPVTAPGAARLRNRTSERDVRESLSRTRTVSLWRSGFSVYYNYRINYAKLSNNIMYKLNYIAGHAFCGAV